ncbi:hypothetical protein BUE80_DR001054 [Diplocarpon rosae]|nr:hypothetical protein BUE80_DR001054 [Diplocarpon rosae]
MSKYVRQDKSQRKHPVASSATSLLRAPPVPAAPRERPGWKGPGFLKRAAKQPAQAASATRGAVKVQEPRLPPALQQLLMNVFRTALPVCQEYESLKPTLQQIRIAVAEGDYQKAFSRLGWLEAYAVRWSPNRALCAATLLVDLGEEFHDEAWFQSLLGIRDEGRSAHSPLAAVCFGGGAAEITAFAAALRFLLPRPSATTPVPSGPDSPTATAPGLAGAAAPILRLHLVDRANWAPVISCLETGLTTPPVLSRYASRGARDTNAPFLPPGALETTFRQSDVLAADQAGLEAMIGSHASLITIFFTLSDLHNFSTAKTAAFLLKADEAVAKQDDVGTEREEKEKEKQKRKYAIQNLLDVVLLEKHVAGPGRVSAWEELVRDRSRLFKLEREVKFPLSLENIKFQVHLFRRCEGVAGQGW